MSLDDTVAPPQAIVNDPFVQRYLDRWETVGRRLESRGVAQVFSFYVPAGERLV